MIRAEEWEPIRAARVDAMFEKLRALPRDYQDWVIRKANDRGLATLHRDAWLGPGEVLAYDALIAVCEREIERKRQEHA